MEVPERIFEECFGVLTQVYNRFNNAVAQQSSGAGSSHFSTKID
jgi:hypothetical protein